MAEHQSLCARVLRQDSSMGACCCKCLALGEFTVQLWLRGIAQSTQVSFHYGGRLRVCFSYPHTVSMRPCSSFFNSILYPTKYFCMCCILVGVELFSTDLTGLHLQFAGPFLDCRIFFWAGSSPAGGRWRTACCGCCGGFTYIEKARLLPGCPSHHVSETCIVCIVIFARKCACVFHCFLFPTRITVRAEQPDQIRSVESG